MKGKIVHIELPAQDTQRALDFWGSLAGWQFQTWQGPVEYHMFEGEPGGGIYPSQEGERGPIVYFESDGIDADVARVRELGGEAEEKHPIPGIGWYVHCRDPEGNAFSLFESDESAPPPTA